MLTLADIKQDQSIRIVAMPELSESVRKHLHAYGLFTGRTIRVLSTRPEMTIQIEETELALEYSVARHILVEVSR
ncbi:MAG: hypothetical protein BGO78_05610 [Chloroflexi bacterium 44-23]|nr:MAG: hypothetical protein BGO78_05610 [Chloroflexi bacterium 44-23]